MKGWEEDGLPDGWAAGTGSRESTTWVYAASLFEGGGCLWRHKDLETYV